MPVPAPPMLPAVPIPPGTPMPHNLNLGGNRWNIPSLLFEYLLFNIGSQILLSNLERNMPGFLAVAMRASFALRLPVLAPLAPRYRATSTCQ
jgi:hypothetical protein